MSKPPPGLRVIGVLGGIGSGKSTAAQILAISLPGLHLDADSLVAELLQKESARQAIEKALGTGLRRADGALDRKKLGERVFQDADALRELENILHPAVRKSLHQSLEGLDNTGKPTWAVFDIPLLLEQGLYKVCDFCLFVDSPPQLRESRACARHHWTPAEWAQRELTQASMDDKKSVADAILSNVGSPDRLEADLRELLPQLLALLPRSLQERWPDPLQSPE